MKLRKSILLLVLISLLLCVVSACSKKEEEQSVDIYSLKTKDKQEKVISNDNFEFHFDPTTTQFKLVKKSTGYTWYSNPKDADKDTLATGINKKDLLSTLSIKYNTESGSETLMTNYGSCIQKGNYNYKYLNDGVQVNYTIGDLQKVCLVPVAVPESRFNEFYNKMDKSSQVQVLMNYKIYDIKHLTADDNKAQLLKTYPELSKEKIYVLRDAIPEYMKQKAEGFFKKVGYTQADYDKDKKRYNVSTASDKPVFDVTVIYKLENDGLRVSIPINKIKCRKEFPIVSVRPLPFFGAGGTSDNGFMIVPDGSGGLINFNNDKQTQNNFVVNVYGWDYGVSRDAVIDETKANMPIFGVSNNSSSFICTLEKGSSYAQIEADVSGRVNNYNSVCADYDLYHSELMDISAKSDTTVRMFQNKLPNEMISQKYTFLDTNDYVSMATAYRNYLMAKYPELKKKTDSDVPVAVELVGAVDKTKHFLGIPRKEPEALTSYNDAVNIVKSLKKDGISDLSVKYNGWFNGGVRHSVPNKIKLISDLGSKKDFKNMVSYMKDNGVKLYLDSTFQFVYRNQKLDNFIAIRDAAKFVNRKLVELYPYHWVWYGQNKDMPKYYLVKPKYYLKNLDSYANRIAGYGVKNIAFGDIGNDLGADYDEKKGTSREKALDLQQNEMSKLSKKGYSMMIDAGNMYAVPYSNMITNLNLGSQQYNIIDEDVPFFEIALHSLVSYTGEPINLAEDYEKNLLKTVETGAGLSFTFMKADSFALQNSNYTKYYSTQYSEWAKTTSDLYARVKKDFSHIYNQYITNHQKIAEGVYMTEYEDGTKVIVNYNDSAYNHNGTEIPAKDYIVEGGKQ